VARVEPITVDVQPARDADLARLPDEFFTDRFRRQRNGAGVLFVAWLRDEPVGDVYLWLEEAEEPPLRRNLPGVPLLTHLEVFPGYRNLGIGTRIIGVAERYLNDLGHQRAALAVRDDNHRAERLYRRLGYVDWGHGLLVCLADVACPGGRRGVAPETCHVLVREFDQNRPRLERTFSSSTRSG